MLGETGATFDGMYRIDRPSTGRLMFQSAMEITYDDHPDSPLPRVPWRELVRILPKNFEPDKATKPVATPSFGQTSEGILNIIPNEFAVGQLPPTTAGQIPYDGGNTVTMRFRHEIGDSKHRTVCYRALAISRWESDFPAGHTFPNPEPELYGITRPKGDDQPTDEDKGKGVPWHIVEIPSTVRPKRPEIVDREVVYDWVPALPDDKIWKKSSLGTQWSFERTRRPGFRLWIARPWYDSGSEEKLAILCWKSARVPKKQVDHYLKLVSRWGTDPVVETEVGEDAPLGLLTREDFYETDGDSRTDLTSPQPPDRESDPKASVTAEVRVGDLPLKIGIATFRPKFHPEERRWFVDVFARAQRYTPFLYLSVARYQPFSLRHCALSEPVRLEPLQLHPPRTLRVGLVATSVWNIQLRLTGVFPDGNDNELRRLVVCRLEKWTGSEPPNQSSALGWVYDRLPEEDALQTNPKLAQLLTEQPGIPLQRTTAGYELKFELPLDKLADTRTRLTVVEVEVYPTASQRLEGRIWTGRVVYADNVMSPVNKQ